MQTSNIILLVVAAIIIFALAAYASYLLFQLKHQRQQQALALEQQKQKHIKRDLKALESISHICRAMVERQCEVSEGSWRLSVLMESLPNYVSQMKANFPAIFTLYSKINHMPILEERKKLSKKERFKLDIERAGHEEEHENAIYDEVEKLLPYTLTLIESLQKS
ncbi:DUF2489 domain-containing protein [Thalassotalea sp. Y01]|uniref:DUF2489 domain-containing protein n=1 Tax=Thalassotalea sp. Y01 TaxID=2729613 RepID=UPI00145D3033|nr:DUF2489 domain-containing protein [Thalassotalea sp. Y01]NMP16886.1 DUF2489 domain-containing protein [Thalassotalea sp. Y01]